MSMKACALLVLEFTIQTSQVGEVFISFCQNELYIMLKDKRVQQ